MSVTFFCNPLFCNHFFTIRREELFTHKIIYIDYEYNDYHYIFFITEDSEIQRRQSATDSKEYENNNKNPSPKYLNFCDNIDMEFI